MSQAARESIDLDVVFVGAGPASLAGAYHLARLLQAHNQTAARRIELQIAILEKGKEVGSHALSGAVLDPRVLAELFPDDWHEAPCETAVSRERLLWLSRRRALPLPIPPPLHNRNCRVVSLGRLLRWLAPRVEAAGIDLFCEFPAAEILLDGERVIGVRTGDRGVGRDGRPKANHEPGMEIRTRVLVLGEGARGSLHKQLLGRLPALAGGNPQVYALGIKEVWQLPPGRVRPGEVIHTLGWPLDRHTFGGGFLYGLGRDELAVGLVVGLDYRNPRLDPHQEFQRWKTHPQIARRLAGGTMTFYGAKAIPEGGWWSMPRLYGDGFLVIGDSAGFTNGQRLKGIHLAMRSGMLAAETLLTALLADDTSAARLADYERRVRTDWSGHELHRVRNFHQGFDRGVFAGVLSAGLGMITGGRGWGLFDRLDGEPGHARMRTLRDTEATSREPVTADGRLTFDKPADIYNSATAHEEDQPGHLLVRDPLRCVEECAETYGNPCVRFCPAAVYEMVADAAAPGGKRLQINASNCIHCKTCDIMDPYQIIDWVTPEGGGGPNYGRM